MLAVMSTIEEDKSTAGSVTSRIKLLKSNFEQGQRGQISPGKVSPCPGSPQARRLQNGVGKNGVSGIELANELNNKTSNVLSTSPSGAQSPKPGPKPLPRFGKPKENVELFERRPRYDTAPESEINDRVEGLVTLSLKEPKMSKASSDSVLDKHLPIPSPRAKPSPPRKAKSEEISEVNPVISSTDSQVRKDSKPPLSPRPSKPSKPEKPPNLSFSQPKPPVPKKLTMLDRPQKADQAMAILAAKNEKNKEGNSPGHVSPQSWKHKSGPPKRPLPAGPGSLDINANTAKPLVKEMPSPAGNRRPVPALVPKKDSPSDGEEKSIEETKGIKVENISTRRPAPSPRGGPAQRRGTKPPPVPVSKRPVMSAAEEQSLYSYAFEPNMQLTTPENRPLKPELTSDSEDSDYEEPDSKAVQGMMRSLERKSGQNHDRYEDPSLNCRIGGTATSPTEAYQIPDESAVKGFIESIHSRSTWKESASDAEEYVMPDENIIPPPPVKKQEMLNNRKNEVTPSPIEDSSSDEEDPTYIDPNGIAYSSRESFRRVSTGVLSPSAYLPDDMQDGSDYIDPENLPSIPAHLRGKESQQTLKTINDDVSDSDDDDEPLYQVYAANLVENQRRMSVGSDENAEAQAGDAYGSGSLQRTLWSELNSVRRSGVLDNLSAEERKRQEAMFEVITSEASYLKSMHILCSHFLAAPEFGLDGTVSVGDVLLDRQQSHFLFSGISAVTKVSEALMCELRTRQEESVLITTISDIIERYARQHFDCYVKYCSNQIFQDRTLNALITNNPRFCEVLGRLETSPKAKSLSMQSFLMLPMQRITRMPLLIDAICHRCEAGSAEFQATDRALRAVSKVVKDCNEGARRLERTEEMYFLQCMLTFKTKPIPLISSSRWLLRRGEIMCAREEAKGPKGMKSKSPLIKRLKGKTKEMYLFLFTDLLLITKMKSEDNFKVMDHCSRGLLRVEDIQPQTPETLKPGTQELHLKHFFSLILLENSKGKTVDYICYVDTATDKLRWLDAFTPAKQGEAEGETVYEEWDCPQVQAIHSYQATQPDEITLQEGDVIKVLRKLSDGWYEGQRLRDGEEGWFPANHTEEILSEHVRARNLLQRYRLLNASDMIVSGFMKK